MRSLHLPFYLYLKYVWEYVMPRVGNLTEENSLCLQRNVQNGDSDSSRVLKIQSSNFQMMTDDVGHYLMISWYVCWKPAVVRERLCKHARCWTMAATDTHATTDLLEALFSVWSVPRLHNKGQLPLWKSPETATRRVGGWCEMVASLGVSQAVDRESLTQLRVAVRNW
jgi:hypothetical protein